VIEPHIVADRAGRMFTLLFLGCLAILAIALYLQHFKDLDPCPWCIVQRLDYIAIGLLALTAALSRPARVGVGVYSVLVGILALAGGAAATYHILLQKDPQRAQACMGSIVEKLLDASRLGKMIPPLLQYDGPCTLKPWSALGLSVPEWSLVGFVLILIWAIALPFIARR
jgi:disulfide bond formation protein DsbB